MKPDRDLEAYLVMEGSRVLLLQLCIPCTPTAYLIKDILPSIVQKICNNFLASLYDSKKVISKQHPSTLSHTKPTQRLSCHNVLFLSRFIFGSRNGYIKLSKKIKLKNSDTLNTTATYTPFLVQILHYLSLTSHFT